MIIGNKVILEEIDEENIEWMRQRRNNPELRKFFREYRDITKSQQLKWYNSKGNNSDPNNIYFQIMKKNDILVDKIVGCCGLLNINWILRSAELSIFLDTENHGNGYAKEALILMYDYFFNEVGGHKIWAEVYEFNKAMGLYKKIGMKEDGILRDNCFYDGKFHNSIILSVLDDEWKNNRNNLITKK